MASLPSEGSPPLSIRHGARVVAPQQYTVEQVLLAVGEQVGHENITYGSRMNKAVVAFLREERLVHLLVERGIVLDDLFVAASPLFVPSTRVTVSGVPPFIPNDLLEKELTRFGKFASGFRVVRLGCKDARLQHVQSLRRQAFMYLTDPSQTLEVSFRVRYENGLYTVYASAGSMKCFECGDVGHKRSSCPHKEQEVRREQEVHASGASEQERAVDAGTGDRPARSGADEQPSTSSAVIGEPLAAPGDGMEVAASAPQAALEEQGVVQATNEVEDGCNDIQDRESVEDNQDSGQTKATASEVGVASVISGSLSAENEEDDLLEDDSLSQCSDVVSQDDHQQSYSLGDINRFLDETFGMQSVEVTEFFPDVDLFIKSVLKIRRVVGYEQLSKQKRFRLKKILTKLRREKRGKTPLKA
ncbi:neuroligin [Sarotherodon galilaeus]